MAATTFLEGLKRRNVIRMAGLYLVGAWLIVPVAGTLFPASKGLDRGYELLAKMVFPK